MKDNSNIREDNNEENLLSSVEAGTTESIIKTTSSSYNQATSYQAGGTNNPAIDPLITVNDNKVLHWDSSIVFYSMPNSTWTATGENNEYQSFSPLTSIQREAVRKAFSQWGSVCNLDMIELSPSSSWADIKLGGSSVPDTSVTWQWRNGNGEMVKADVWYGNNTVYSPTNPIVGSYDYHTILHEIGHALGLKHPHDTTGYQVNLNDPNDSYHDSMEYTVMSYKSYDGAYNGYTNGYNSFASGPMMDDIAAIQYLYGANYTYNSGDTVYKFDPTQSKIFQTIWDGGGKDTYDLSAYTTNIKVDLRPGEWSSFNTNQLAYLGDGNYAQGNVANALLYNGDTRSLIENVVGGTGADTLIGNQVNNVLDGGAGADIIDAGDGNDTVVYDSADILVVGGSGTDTLNASSSTTNIIIDLSSSAQFTGFENILTGTGNDKIIGTSGVNGINAGAGNDTIDGRAGADTIKAGDGNDLVVYDSADILVEGGFGTDTLNGGSSTTNITIDLSTSTQFTGFENILTGIGNDNIIGTNGVNGINAGAGNDTIDGRAGADTIKAGDGNDLVVYDSADILVEGGSGTDTLNGGSSTANTTIDLSTSAQFIGFENILTGTGNDKIIGTSGVNGINAGAGNDTIDGRAGADTIKAGDGNDLVVYDSADILVEGGSGTDTLNGGSSTTNITINLSTSTQFTGFENILTGIGNDNIIGTSGVNGINAGAGNDSIDGRVGADTIKAGDGNDLVVYDSADILVEGGFGTDTLNGGSSTTNITIDLSTSTQFTGFENILTGIGNDNIIGTNGVNGINAGAGNDSIDGRAGADTIKAGDGDDIVVYDSADILVAGGDGTDTLDASANTTGVTLNLSTSTQFTSFENITTGIGNDNITGTIGANIINAGGGNDILYGGAGNDILEGGLGDDLYIFGVGDGNDTINSYVGNNNNNGFDTLQLQNLALTGMSFSKNINDLICTITQTGETICLSNWLLGTDYQVDHFQFADGTLTATQISQKIA